MLCFMECVQYLIYIQNLREEFAQKLGFARHTEAYKIWARWIISHRSLFSQTSLFLPSDQDNLDADTQIILEMAEKNVETEKAQEIYQWLLRKTQIINNLPV